MKNTFRLYKLLLVVPLALYLSCRVEAQPPASISTGFTARTNAYIHADKGVRAGTYGMRIDPTDSVPTPTNTVSLGNFYFHSSEGTIKVYSGGQWRSLLDTADTNGMTAAVGTFIGSASSANLKAAVTDEQGSGALVFANGPTLVAPALGTPASGTLTSCSGLPIATGLAVGTSANLNTVINDQTGSGVLVFGTGPTLSGTTVIEGSLDLGTVETFSDGDGTPDVSGGAYFNTHASPETITDFDGSGIVDGQVITVFSKDATTFDDGGLLRAGSADLVTASGDVTTWMYDGTDWVLLSFMDDSENVSLSAYGELGAAETIAGNWVNTANPWADNEVADALTVAEAGIAAAITRDEEWNSFSELNSAVSDKTLINEEDSVIFENNVRVGDGTPSQATAVEELYVEGDIEGHKNLYLQGATPSLNFVDSTGSEEDWQIISGAQTINGSSEDGLHFIDTGDPRIVASITDTGSNFHLGDGFVAAERQVKVLSSGHTLTIAESKGSFITQSTANTITLLHTGRTTGMEVTILVTADVVVPIIDGDGDAASDLIWKDGSDGDTITNSGSAGECITLIFDGTFWRAIRIEGNWTLSG